MIYTSIILAFLLLAEASIWLEPDSLEARGSSSSNPIVSQNLHILPLGASITYGLHSLTGNGYREPLRQLLLPTNITFVGSRCSGTMSNGNNEGHPGYQISQMQAVASPDIKYNPNVVLIYVGTNDMIATAAVSESLADMLALTNFLRTNLPDAFIVVSNLFDSLEPRVQQRIDEYNSQLYKLQLPSNVVVANISEKLTHADFSADGIHPNDDGYQKMANFFYQVIVTAYTNGDIPDRSSYQDGVIRCSQSAATTAMATTTNAAHNSPTSTSGACKGAAAIGLYHYSLLFVLWHLIRDVLR